MAAGQPLRPSPGSRSRSAFLWAGGFGTLGALALGGVALLNWAAATVGLFLVQVALPDSGASLDNARLLTAAICAIAACLAVALGGGWRLSPEDALLPPALTGALWGLAGTAVGYVVLWLALGFNPLG